LLETKEEEQGEFKYTAAEKCRDTELPIDKRMRIQWESKIPVKGVARTKKLIGEQAWRSDPIQFYEQRYYYSSIDQYYSIDSLGKTLTELKKEFTDQVKNDGMDSYLPISMMPNVIEFVSNPKEDKRIISRKLTPNVKSDTACQTVKEPYYHSCTGIENSKVQLTYNPRLWIYGSTCTKYQLWYQRQAQANAVYRWACIYTENDAIKMSILRPDCTKESDDKEIVATVNNNRYTNLHIENFTDSSRLIISYDKEEKNDPSCDDTSSTCNYDFKNTMFTEWEWLGHDPSNIRQQPLLKLPNLNKFNIYLGRLAVFDYPYRINGSCMYDFQITASNTKKKDGTAIGPTEIKTLFDVNTCDGTVVFKGRSDNTVTDTYEFTVVAYLALNRLRSKSFTITLKLERDLFSPDKMSSQILDVPVDAAGNDSVTLAVFPAVDANGNTLEYEMASGSFGLFLLGKCLKGSCTKSRLRTLAPMEDNSWSNPNYGLLNTRNRKLSNTNYELKYVGTGTNKAGDKLNFSLQVYDGTGKLVSDQSYDVPVSGTVADHVKKQIPVISENGNVVMNQSDLFQILAPVTDNST